MQCESCNTNAAIPVIFLTTTRHYVHRKTVKQFSTKLLHFTLQSDGKDETYIPSSFEIYLKLILVFREQDSRIVFRVGSSTFIFLIRLSP
jgi:hypothetical protein